MATSDSESVTHTSCSTASRNDADPLPLSAAPLSHSSAEAAPVPPLIISQTPCEDAYTREFPIDIPTTLKAVLERDHYFIKEKRKVTTVQSNTQLANTGVDKIM